MSQDTKQLQTTLESLNKEISTANTVLTISGMCAAFLSSYIPIWIPLAIGAVNVYRLYNVHKKKQVAEQALNEIAEQQSRQQMVEQLKQMENYKRTYLL